MPKEYTLKESSWSSHGRMLSWLASGPPRRVLDLGCSSGLLAAEIRALGHEVTGVDMMEFPEALGRMDHFFQANLDEGVPAAVGGGYDVVIAGDVLEHVRHPDLILRQIRELLAPGGRALVSIPNFSHWYPRFRVMAGRFDYDDQGILDRGHVRFFTRRSFSRLVLDAGLSIRRTEAIGVPVERLINSRSQVVEWASRVDRFAAAVYPSLFAYQYLLELTPNRAPDVLKAEPASKAMARTA
jgi:SAM-dependent methyltransferase